MPDEEFIDGLARLIQLCIEHDLQYWHSEAPACDTVAIIGADGEPHECWQALDGKINVAVAMTPEQALGLEPGRGTCKDESECIDRFICSLCGAVLYTYIDGEETLWMYDHPTMPSFCPNCGARIEVK